MNQIKDHSELVEKILSNARWAVVLRLVTQTFSWLSTIIVVRFISPNDYGLNAMLEAPLELMMLLSTFGLDMAMVRLEKIEPNELRSTFGWLLIINGLLFLAYFLGGPLFAAYFNEPRLDLLSKALAFIFLLVPLRAIPNALLDRELKFKLRAFVEMIANLIAVAVTLALAIKGMGVWALVVGLLVNRITQTAMLMILEPWIIMPNFDFAPVRQMAAFGGIMTLSGGIVLLTDKLFSLIAGPRMGSEMLGIFAVAAQFAFLPLSKVMPMINPLIFPSFSKFKDHPTHASYYLGRSLNILALGLFPAIIGMACISNEFVRTVLGEKWLAAALPLSLLSLSMPLRMVTSLIIPIVSSMGRADLNLILVSLKFFILLSTILITIDHGIFGLVIASLITEFIVVLTAIQLSKHIIRICLIDIYNTLRPAIGSTLVMAACVLWVRIMLGHDSSPWIVLILEIFVGIISYFTTLVIFFPNQIKNVYRLIFGSSRNSVLMKSSGLKISPLN